MASMYCVSQEQVKWNRTNVAKQTMSISIKVFMKYERNRNPLFQVKNNDV